MVRHALALFFAGFVVQSCLNFPGLYLKIKVDFSLRAAQASRFSGRHRSAICLLKAQTVRVVSLPASVPHVVSVIRSP